MMQNQNEFLDQVLKSVSTKLPPEINTSTLISEIRDHARVVIGAELSPTPANLGASKIGGKPDLPSDFAWPTEDGKEQHLVFIAQFSLAEVYAHDQSTQLPDQGMLWLFSIADADRAYAYEIYSGTAKLYFQPSHGKLHSTEHPVPGSPVIDERSICFGPSLVLEQRDDSDEIPITAKRFDHSVEQLIWQSVREHSGRVGPLRFLGNPHLLDEENIDLYQPDKDTLLFELDGDTVSRAAFGEGVFHFILNKEELLRREIERTRLIFEPGT